MIHRLHALATVALCVAMAVSAAAETGREIEAANPTGKGGYRFESRLSLGGPEAPEAAQFYERAGRTQVGADAQGRIYVLDSGGPRIQVFDSAGRFQRSIGKAGEGPGELKMPGRLAVAADGSCAVFDVALHRITVFDAAGKLGRDQVTSDVVRDMGWNARGELVCVFAGRGGPEVVEAFDPAGKSVWSTPRADTAPGGRVMMLEIDGETAASRLAFDANGAPFVASRDVYALQRIDRGSVTQTWTRTFERQARRPLPRPQEGDEGGGPQMVIVRRTEGGPQGPQTSVSSSSDGHGDGATIQLGPEDIERMMPKHAPDMRGVLAWPDGRVWVLTAQNDGDNMVADEWSAQGEYRKRFAVPRRFDWLALGADGRLYGVEHDRDDYPIVHRLEVLPAN